MFKRALSALLVVSVVHANLWAGATFSRVTTWSSGNTLTASALNAEFDSILNNLTPGGVDDYSANTTEMRSVADPYPASSESLATSLQGELERMRYQILETKKAMQASNVTHWYQDLPTAGVFTIASSSVGVNDTTPSHALDVTGTGHFTGAVTLDSTLAVTGNITSDGNITTTGDDVDVSTHLAVAGNLSVSGTTNFTNPGYTHIYAKLNSNVTTSGGGITVLDQWTDSHDSLSEMGSTTFTVTSTGYYQICFRAKIAQDTNPLTTMFGAVYQNGSLLDYVFYEESFSLATKREEGCTTFSLTAGDAITLRAGAATAGGNPVIQAGGTNDYTTVSIDRMF